MTETSHPYQEAATALIDEYGWDRAVLLATAVRGYVYDSPNPGPYRDEAEAIYKRLGWEQAALLAAWFRDSRNRPSSHPKKRPGGWPSTTRLEPQSSGRRPGGWPTAVASHDAPRMEST